MRITNRIMQRNNLSNINTNKVYQDKLSTQMSSEKKINRPSDDPVVAIRALRLRSNVTEITQYYSKNIPDAESWLKVTEDALSNLSGVLTNMISRCTKGVDSYLTTANRQILLEELKNLSEAVYSTGNADYAGRYVFTGYRTDTPLSFKEAEKLDYTITEQLDKSVIDTVTKVNADRLLEINSSTYANAGVADVNENKISSVNVHRIRLAYNSCKDDAANVRITFYEPQTNGNSQTFQPQEWSGGDITKMNSYETDPVTSKDPYAYVADNPNAIVYIPDTGELLLGDTRYEKLMLTKNGVKAEDLDKAEIRVTYEKSAWQKGDLRPEHYFYSKLERKDGAGNALPAILYNEEYLTNGISRQAIEYDVGYNQTIRVNSTADQCFNHGIGREVDDIMKSMQEVQSLEGVKADLEKLLESVPSDIRKEMQELRKKIDAAKPTDPVADWQAALADKEKELQDCQPILQNQMAAVNKALTYAKEKEQQLFSAGITALQGYLDEANLSITECGSRSSKLELVKNRSQNQKTTYETLKSENEDVDITEVAIGLKAAELTYDAALMAAGKVMKTTLLNFI